jgi:hypothetical protein
MHLCPAAEPIIAEAEAALNSLDKGSLGELKSFGSPAAEIVQVGWPFGSDADLYNLFWQSNWRRAITWKELLCFELVHCVMTRACYADPGVWIHVIVICAACRLLPPV